MKLNSILLLRITVVVILLMHSIPGVFNNGINDFGNLYLNQVGFAPIGLPLAWAIKISHILAAACFLFGKYMNWAGIVTIIILIVGIFMVHLKDGWFVVGAGRNGIEFNVLLIVVILTIMFPNGLERKVEE